MVYPGELPRYLSRGRSIRDRALPKMRAQPGPIRCGSRDLPGESDDCAGPRAYQSIVRWSMVGDDASRTQNEVLLELLDGSAVRPVVPNHGAGVPSGQYDIRHARIVDGELCNESRSSPAPFSRDSPLSFSDSYRMA